VSSDGKGLVSQAGAVLLWETMRVTGLGRGLSQALKGWRAPRAVHDPGKIVADLAAALALGGDCLADIAVLREQPELAGPVASDPVVSRLVRQLAADLPGALKAIRSTRAAARERAWALAGDAAPGADGGLVTSHWPDPAVPWPPPSVPRARAAATPPWPTACNQILTPRPEPAITPNRPARCNTPCRGPSMPR
jgi:Transposase DDE domain group 1